MSTLAPLPISLWRVDYRTKVLATAPANLIAYWPLHEASGSVAHDANGGGCTGAYSNVTLGQPGIGDGLSVPSFNGTTSYCNISTAKLTAAFNSTEGTLALWAQVSGAGVWTDGIARRCCAIGVNGTNVVRIRRNSSNNSLIFDYIAGGTSKSVVKSSVSPTGEMHLAISWSKSNDQVIAYYNGAQEGATQTGLGTWVGSLGSTACVIGATDTAPTSPWSGFIGHGAVWSTPLTSAQIANLAVVS